MLDIGGDVGAAIVHTPPSLIGAELEIRRLGDPWEGKHVAVRARHLPTGVGAAALFDRLYHGTYQVRVRNRDSRQRVYTFEVTVGRVGEVRLTG